MWFQTIVTLTPRHRGFHLVTDQRLSPVREALVGIAVGEALETW